MNKTSRFTSLLLIITLVFTLGFKDAFASKYVSIADIKEDVKDGWHQAYTYNGETIKVDVDIEVPDVDTVPIVRVRCPVEIYPNNAPENADIDLYPTEGFHYIVESRPGAIFSLGRARFLQDYAEDAQAENSPFSREAALAFVEKTLAPYIEQCGSFDLDLKRIYVESRGYKIISSDASGEKLDFASPLTDMGVYQIEFNQKFYGIPYSAISLPFTWPLKIEEGLMLSVGEIRSTVASENDYTIAFHPVIEDGVLSQDIPLTPFAEVKKEFERLIESGYIRNVYSIRLEYCFFNNPHDFGNTYLLLPVWELNGVYVQNPKDPTPARSFEDRKTETLYGGTPGYVNAQTGQYLNPEDKSPTRSYGTYFAWDEVN